MKKSRINNAYCHMFRDDLLARVRDCIPRVFNLPPTKSCENVVAGEILGLLLCRNARHSPLPLPPSFHPIVLLQHGCDGHRSGAVAENQVRHEDREVDGDSEERLNLRIGFFVET
ncbi:hypothetical protein JHK84_031871 [Glycine max]|nr:hypothetical protein JHK86_031730 [Glycine max]KAG5146328.1 hypothetical protein JHK84_031871 [Glycine max]